MMVPQGKTTNANATTKIWGHLLKLLCGYY